MKRRRAPKAAIKAESLTVGSADIGAPTLGQVHDLGKRRRIHNLTAVGIATASPEIAPEFAPDEPPSPVAGKKRKRTAFKQQAVIEQLVKLQEQGFDLSKMEIKEIARQVNGVPSRDTIRRARDTILQSRDHREG
jgi:hypothetical protein